MYISKEKIQTEEQKFDLARVENESALNILNKYDFLSSFLNGIPDKAFILDFEGNVLLSNEESDNHFSNNNICTHLNCNQTNGGRVSCGQSKHCNDCAVYSALRNNFEEDPSYSEMAIINSIDDGNLLNFNLQINATRIKLKNHELLLLVIEDKTNGKRKEALERIFFHDVLNTANAVNGLSELMQEAESLTEMREYAEMLQESINELIHEINIHKDIHVAEKDLLEARFEKTTPNIVLKRIKDMYQKHYLSEGKTFIVEDLEDDFDFDSDITLLIRSVGNLVKNALEASKKGDTVDVFARTENGRVYFHVFNSGVIPDNIQPQIFYKSFSTKGGNERGVGTYSVKLLVEKYLQGSVYFVSNDNVKTIFTIEIPLIPKLTSN